MKLKKKQREKNKKFLEGEEKTDLRSTRVFSIERMEARYNEIISSSGKEKKCQPKFLEPSYKNI